MSVTKTLIAKVAAENVAIGVEYSQKIACEFVKTASGLKELSPEDTEKVSNSVFVPVVAAGLAKLSAK
jgi:hypothetical protein